MCWNSVTGAPALSNTVVKSLPRKSQASGLAGEGSASSLLVCDRARYPASEVAVDPDDDT